MNATLIGILIAVAVILYLLDRLRGRLPKASGRLGDSPRYFKGLLKKAPLDGAFLVMTVKGTEQFLQFRNTANGFEVYFPLVTERQQSDTEKFRSACAELGLDVKDNDASLNTYVKVPPEEMARIVTRLFQMMYATTERTPLEFEWYEIDMEST